ncbi:MAG: hypothetical protein GC154_08200 [bacterium]|nr:hypothetical protein [bacterium]
MRKTILSILILSWFPLCGSAQFIFSPDAAIDFNRSGKADAGDLFILAAAWRDKGSEYDLDFNNLVDADDLLLFRAAWDAGRAYALYTPLLGAWSGEASLISAERPGTPSHHFMVVRIDLADNKPRLTDVLSDPFSTDYIALSRSGSTVSGKSPDGTQAFEGVLSGDSIAGDLTETGMDGDLAYHVELKRAAAMSGDFSGLWAVEFSGQYADDGKPAPSLGFINLEALDRSAGLTQWLMSDPAEGDFIYAFSANDLLVAHDGGGETDLGLRLADGGLTGVAETPSGWSTLRGELIESEGEPIAGSWSLALGGLYGEPAIEWMGVTIEQTGTALTMRVNGVDYAGVRLGEWFLARGEDGAGGAWRFFGEATAKSLTGHAVYESNGARSVYVMTGSTSL